jgi:hypothetical protein
MNYDVDRERWKLHWFEVFFLLTFTFAGSPYFNVYWDRNGCSRYFSAGGLAEPNHMGLDVATVIYPRHLSPFTISVVVVSFFTVYFFLAPSY